jgi:signal transduction histidine kinase
LRSWAEAHYYLRSVIVAFYDRPYPGGKELSSSSAKARLVVSNQSSTSSNDRAAGGKPLRLLLVEDLEQDAMLVLRALRKGGYEPTYVRVETHEAFRRQLDTETWDVIISDHSLPNYGGMLALADLKATGKDIPFILISGTIGETVAVDAIKAGAQDYVLKADLTRLAVAVEREVRESGVRAEQAKMRERLVISERMASAGTLAAGVAHEINNPLAIAMANLDIAAGAVGRIVARAEDLKAYGSRAAASLQGDLNDLDEPLRDAREALARIRDIVRDVKLFSRPDDEMLGAVDVRRVADSSARMAWNEIRHRAKLVKQYGEVPLVTANESRLGQVVLNLLVNAAQAMPEGQANRHEIKIVTKTSRDGSAVLEVTDTGTGISKENLARIFDPFFTTKPIGVGTGLGLAICHGIVTELGGRIDVQSELGKGTMFRLTLPAARESPTIVKAAIAQPTGLRSRVLIVDDEAALGRALRRTLSPYHEVTVLTSGAKALANIRDGERYDAIVLDVMMPEMSGMDLHRELTRVAPAQAERIIFLTGGAFSPAAREFLDTVANPRLEKPVDTANLITLIEGIASREALAAGRLRRRGAG